MTFTELNKLNAKVTEEYETLQATKQKVFVSIHARHKELHEALESLNKTNVAARNDIDDELDAISSELDALLESMDN